MSSILVIGAGSWGTALAIVLARNENTTHMWGHDASEMQTMVDEKANQRYIPGITFPETLKPFVDFEEASKGIDDILMAVPSHAFSEVIQKLKPHLTERTRLIVATKGLDPETGYILQSVVEKHLGKDIPLAILAGPSFAAEVAKGLPTAVAVSGNSDAFVADVIQYFNNPHFRVYQSHDMLGMQLCGAVKNVLAIATGISDGLSFGTNARVALITRGLAEMMRLVLALGGDRDTVTGLAGLGDLVLTCSDNLSRNRRFGIALGDSLNIEEAQKRVVQVVEGVQNAKQVHELAKKHDVDMPIVEQIYEIVYGNRTAEEAVKILLMREVGEE